MFTAHINAKLIVCLLAAFLVSACATVHEDLESPVGPVAGDQFGSMEIIGVLNRMTTSMNRPNGNPVYKETIKTEVPVGTEFIVPAVKGWRLAYGELEPNTAEAHTTGPSTGWNSADHHFGVGLVDVFVKDINAPDLSVNPPTQTAVIEVRLNLIDYNGDDKWFGVVDYTLICLRRINPKPTPTPRPR